MDDLIALLQDIGATGINHLEASGADDVLMFNLKGKSVVIRGVHYNDSTGGISAEVIDEKQTSKKER